MDELQCPIARKQRIAHGLLPTDKRTQPIQARITKSDKQDRTHNRWITDQIK